MIDDVDELTYVRDFMEFSKLVDLNTKFYLIEEGFVTNYDDIVLLTKKGEKYLQQNKKIIVDKYHEIEDYYKEEFYPDDFDFLTKKGDENDF